VTVSVTITLVTHVTRSSDVHQHDDDLHDGVLVYLLELLDVGADQGLQDARVSVPDLAGKHLAIEHVERQTANQYELQVVEE